MTGATRVWMLNAALAVMGAFAFLIGVQNLHTVQPPFEFHWWALAVGFGLAEIFVVHVEFRRDAHSVSLSEIPLVLGLFFAPPAQLVLAQFVGAGVALAFHRRQSLLKLTFNLGHFFVETCLAVLIFHSLTDLGHAPESGEWSAAFVATLVTTVVGVVSVFVAISLSGSVMRGQYPAKISYVLRPRRSPSAARIKSRRVSWNTSSPNGTSQPPWSNPPLRSSSLL